MALSYKQCVSKHDPQWLYPQNIQTLQVNLGNLCNQSCKHCHVSASPQGRDIMSKEHVLQIIEALKMHPFRCLDITGGAPEMNPHFRFLLESAKGLVDQLMVRTNLTVFFEPSYEDLPEYYAAHKVTLVASLPCYTQDTVDAQRGDGVFEQSIQALKLLNAQGYGQELVLNLVYNPSGDFLPAEQAALEQKYKQELSQRYSVRFNQLFVLANLPVGRFKHSLKAQGRLDNYVSLLEQNFNPQAAEAVMCRSLVNVDWKGQLYHCDFNQQEGLPIRRPSQEIYNISDLQELLDNPLEVITGKHCYGCSAGAGSSCTGALS